MMIGLGFVTISNHLVQTLDAVLIAAIHNSAKVWVAYTEYTISNATIIE